MLRIFGKFDFNVTRWYVISTCHRHLLHLKKFMFLFLECNQYLTPMWIITNKVVFPVSLFPKGFSRRIQLPQPSRTCLRTLALQQGCQCSSRIRETEWSGCSFREGCEYLRWDRGSSSIEDHENLEVPELGVDLLAATHAADACWGTKVGRAGLCEFGGKKS